MQTLEELFEDSLRNYKGKNVELLSVDEIATKLHQQLPRIFTLWMEDEYLAPISKVTIENQSGYTCSSFFLMTDKNAYSVKVLVPIWTT